MSRDLYLSSSNLHATFLRLLISYMKRANPGQGIKFQLHCNVFLEKYVFEAKKMVWMDVWFPVDMKTILSLKVLEKQLNGALHDIE